MDIRNCVMCTLKRNARLIILNFYHGSDQNMIRGHGIIELIFT